FIIRADELAGESHLGTEPRCIRLDCKKGVGTSFEHKSIALLGLNYTAQAIRFLKQHPIKACTILPCFFQVIGRSKSGDPPADNRNPLHVRETIPAAFANSVVATLASAATNVGEAFKDSGRHSRNPCSVANSRKLISTS